MKMHRYFILLAVLLSVSPNVMADGQDVSPEKRAAITQLLEVTGALELGQQFSSAMVTQLANTLRATHANVPQKALDIRPEVVNGLVAENIGIVKLLPGLLQESIVAGQKWGQTLGPEIARRLQARYKKEGISL